MMAATIVQKVLGAEPYTPADWVLIIGSIFGGLCTFVAAVASAVVSVRNGRKVEAVHGRVDEVHECLHRQAAEVKAVVQATPGAEATAAAIMANDPDVRT